MKINETKLKLLAFCLMMIFSAISFGQVGITGTWKYTAPGGEMNMQIDGSTININGQTFPYSAQGNVLMITEQGQVTPYPYMLDGNQLTLEFPGGMELVFTRSAAGIASPGKLPQSMSRPSSGTGQGSQSSSLAGRWVFQNQEGQLNLEFLSSGQLAFNGETTQYQLKEGIIQAMGDYGWIDYPYTIDREILTITFPDGTNIPFSRAATSPGNQQNNLQGINRQQAGEGSSWQLRGTLCSWSGSSNDYSSYSRTQKVVFDGQGNFQAGSESSFSGDAGIAYSGNPNAQSGTYIIGERTVTLYYQDGSVREFKINMRQDSGMITELMYSGTLYATGLCE